MTIHTRQSSLIHVPPTVIIPQGVLRAMADEARRYQDPTTGVETETGETLVGIIIPAAENDPFREPVIFVLGTIPAGSALREIALFELGGEYQVKIFSWLRDNWEAMRELSRTKPGHAEFRWPQSVPLGMVPKMFDLPLSDIGDWHKHPGGMTYPSGGDLQTATTTLQDPELNVHFLMAPVVTLSKVPSTTLGWQDTILRMEDGNYSVDVSFSYLSRRMLSFGMQDFIRVTPHIVPDEWVPKLPSLSWDLMDPERMAMELKLLTDYGCTVQTYYRETRGGPPLEVCFEITRPDSTKPWDFRLFIETQVNYPLDPPALRIIKGEEPSVASQPQQQTQRLSWWRKWLLGQVEQTPLIQLPMLIPQNNGANPFVWKSNCTLLNLIMFLEKGGKVWREQPAQTTPASGTE